MKRRVCLVIRCSVVDPLADCFAVRFQCLSLVNDQMEADSNDRVCFRQWCSCGA